MAKTIVCSISDKIYMRIGMLLHTWELYVAMFWHGILSQSAGPPHGSLRWKKSQAADSFWFELNENRSWTSKPLALLALLFLSLAVSKSTPWQSTNSPNLAAFGPFKIYFLGLGHFSLIPSGNSHGGRRLDPRAGS